MADEEQVRLLRQDLKAWNEWRSGKSLSAVFDARGVDLRGADLRGADLRGANLLEADLEGADLSGADLQGANLEGARLQGASLAGADLTGAELGNVVFPSAGEVFDRVFEGTVLTDTDFNFWTNAITVGEEPRLDEPNEPVGAVIRPVASSESQRGLELVYGCVDNDISSPLRFGFLTRAASGRGAGSGETSLIRVIRGEVRAERRTVPRGIPSVTYPGAWKHHAVTSQWVVEGLHPDIPKYPELHRQ